MTFEAPQGVFQIKPVWNPRNSAAVRVVRSSDGKKVYAADAADADESDVHNDEMSDLTDYEVGEQAVDCLIA